MAKKTSVNTGLAILTGLAAAAVAGAYFVYGNKEVQKKAKKVKGWALKAKGEVLQKLETLKQVDEALYHQVVDTVMKKYEGVKSIDTSEAMAVAKELKSHWKNIKKELSGEKKKVVKVAKKIVSDTKTVLKK